MAEGDQPRGPTLLEYRAMLAAAKEWEAATRLGDDPSFLASAVNAFNIFRHLYYASGLEAFPGDITCPDFELRQSVHRVRAVIYAVLDRRVPDREHTTIAEVMFAFAAVTPQDRHRLGAATDALAAAIALAEVLAAMPAEDRERVMAAMRRGPGRSEDFDRNERIRAAAAAGKKPAAIARTEGVSVDAV